MPGIAVLLTTAGSEDEASNLARLLVERKLAACVNVIPGVSSTYRWQGSVKRDSEWLLVINTRGDRFEDVRAAIRELHTYELPEVIMMEAAAVDPAYRAWIDESVQDAG
jgi:periplasmic divalent cation tolerance protein